jgi:hypothetical protein
MTPAETYLANQDHADRKGFIRQIKTAEFWDSIERIIKWSAIISGAIAVVYVIIPALIVIWRS